MKSQEQIKETFDLILKIENKSYVLIPHLAKELKVDKFQLTQYIIDNPKVFYFENEFSYKHVKVKRYLWPGQKEFYWDTNYVKNKSLGLAVKNVYLNPDDNYRTDEWLQKMIETQKHYIAISEMNNYGYIQGYYLSKDVKPEKQTDDKYRFWKWRNTDEKLDYLKSNGYTNEGGAVYGGFGDSHSVKYDHEITLNSIGKLQAMGWTMNEVKPLSK